MQRGNTLLSTVVLTLVAALILSGCASYRLPARAAFHPSLPPEQQAADRAYCEAHAKQVTGYDPVRSPAEGAAIGALLLGAVGAAAGAAGGAATGGSPGRGAATGAVIGGVGGGLAGGAGEAQRMHDLYTKEYSVCLRAKGYIVE